MIVYHGTARSNLKGLLSSSPLVRPQAHLNGKRAFCTTTDFKIATLFALRRSPPSVLTGDESEMGVVVEYGVAWSSREGEHWAKAICRGVLQDEKEIAIFKPSMIYISAVWTCENGEWIRKRKRARYV